MQTNIAPAGDYDQAWAARHTRTTILIVDDDTTARLTLSAMISNEDEYRVFLGSDRPQTDQRPESYGRWSTLPPGRAGSIRI